MNVMLLAAGEGTRLRPYTEVLPKPAIPFLTIPLAGHALSFLRGNPLDKLVVNTFHLPGKIHELFHTLPHKAQELLFSDEKEQILGSGGGLGNARNHFIGGGDFIMMNADEVILPKDPEVLEKALLHHKQKGALATLLVMDHPGVGTQFGGVWTDSQNRVLGFGKTAFAGSHKAWHFVGVQILSEEVFNFIPYSGESNILYDALTVGIQSGKLVQTYPFECSWFETGNPTDFIQASNKCFDYLSNNSASYQKQALAATLQEFGEDELIIEAKGSAHMVRAKSARIEENVKIEGLFVAGKNCVVGKNSHLKNVIAGAHVQIPFSTSAENKIFL